MSTLRPTLHHQYAFISPPSEISRIYNNVHVIKYRGCHVTTNMYYNLNVTEYCSCFVVEGKLTWCIKIKLYFSEVRCQGEVTK